MLSRIPYWLKNKYVITAIIFVFFITFINDIDLIFVLKSRAELNDLKDEVDQLVEENEHLSKVLKDYQSNNETAEKFARENYYMHKENEDLYIIKEKAHEK